MSIVHELPFLPKQHLLAAADPTAVPRSDAPLRTLKRRDVVSDGFDLKLRTIGSGRLVGSLQVYCSLNRDAIRLARMQLWSDAARLGREAARIERSSHARKLKALLERTPVAVAPAIAWHAYMHAVQVGPVRDCALRVADSVARARAKVGALGRWRTTVTGFIVGLEGGFAEVESEPGSRFRVPRGPLVELGWDRIGAAVAVHLEQHQQFVLWEVEPALSDAGESTIDPFDYEWPASDALTARVEELLAGPGTIPLPAPRPAAAR